MIIDELTWYDDLSSEQKFICGWIAGSGVITKQGVRRGEKDQAGGVVVPDKYKGVYPL